MIGTIRLVIRTDKPRKSGKCPVELIYSIEGQRKYLNTGINLFHENWDKKSQSAIFYKTKDHRYLSKDEILDINRDFAKIKNTISDIEKVITINGGSLSSEKVISEYKTAQKPITKKEDPSNLVYDFIDKYIEENAPSRVKGSLGVYKSLKTHLKNFQTTRRRNFKFSDIDYSFFQSFNNFLINYTTSQGKTLNNITIAKQISTLKTFLGYAKQNGIKVSDNYKEFSIKRQKLEVIALTEHEFSTLFHLDLSDHNKIFESYALKDKNGTPSKISHKVLDKVRDVLVFACATGLRYSDEAQLRWNHIKQTEIRLTVTKTKEVLIIPLNGYSSTILSKYEGQARPLPIISNQKYNDYIKALCEMAQINEPIEIIRFRGSEEIRTVYPKYELCSSHIGRKTFCTLSLERGIPAETVMKISGHSDYKSFQRYVKITEERKRREMHKAWGGPTHLKIVKSV